ncbi:putative DNA double-strand break repair Rad50 ATPase [Halomicronema hongdechloris C2206]|uniref:Nuclease SbcCD subunit C n=2 Tax=Halomicronema hongdechloris TaxID=1209493 RepID=A0A1Z3HNU7_9CYAN|nr:putative DNA double-strand break repair Rad50 ATPase [Halomicronema hongdechloris C2206]
MIPKQLTLTNFLSYRQASLNFQGLHVACIAGANGAGKSSLLEAISWALWGQSRGSCDDDVIHGGEMEAQVDFVFEHHHQTYRILRSRRRRQNSSLEFQVETESGFLSLTRRGVRATQQLICQQLRLDYDTFVNSAYLRQGRADEFMLKRPSERKQILADLLKLDQYDQLADKAKERVRQAKAEAKVLEQTLVDLQAQLSQQQLVAQQQQELTTRLATLDQQQQADQTTLAGLQEQRQRRQRWQQQRTLLLQQVDHGQQVRSRLRQELQELQQRQQAVSRLLAQAEAISQGYGQWSQLQAEEARLSQVWEAYQRLHAQREQLQQQVTQPRDQLLRRQQQAQQQLQGLEQEGVELAAILQRQDQVMTAMAQLRQAQERLHQLDQRQLQVLPLLQQCQALQRDLQQAALRLAARLEELSHSEQTLKQHQAQQPQLQQAVLEVTHTLEQLQRRRAYQERVREKGLERRRFMEQLQDRQRACETQLAQLEQKMELLAQPDAPCPVCDRTLGVDHRQGILARHRQEQQDLQREIWVIREQLAVSEKELQVLRQEYRDLDAELANYDPTLEQRGQLQAQLDSSAGMQQRLQQILQEQTQLRQALEHQNYAADVQTALQAVEQQLAELPYDERDHALARGQVDRLRWAEIKQAEIKQAQQKHRHLQGRRQALEATLAEVEAQLAALAASPQQQHLSQVEQQLAHLDYSPDYHHQLRQQLRAAQDWRLRYQALEQARQQQPQVQQQVDEIERQVQMRSQELSRLQTELTELDQRLQTTPDPQAEVVHLEQQLQGRQQAREQHLAQLGALRQQYQYLQQQQAHLDSQQQALTAARHQQRVHQAVAHAFGRNGIQALIIETLLPQLEAETNQILSRLSANQLHVQFVTQRVGRSRQSKLIDTLDILIADTQGTRPYETYSGGEGFRVNFAIRLALARLLAQRSGVPLQMLIIDEGFGTQDQQGCERLIAAINAIATDFACILVVTHIPHFREAFQTRIDVVKTEAGSRLDLSM